MTHLIADTLSCISAADANKLGLTFLPQIIIFGDESYRDDTEMNSDTFIKRLKTSPSLPKTSAPNPSLYTPYLKELVKTNEPILIICPSKLISGTLRSAEVAAIEFPDADIRIIDTAIIGSGLGSIVRKAVEWQQAGLSADEIENKVNEMAARNRTYFLVDTLEYLHKGGRIGAAKALVGSMLQMKPILSISEGQVGVVTTERTRKKAIARFLELIFIECPNGKDGYPTIQHGGVLNQAHELSAEMDAKLSVTEIPITYLPPAIIVHCGPGVLGVSFFVKE